MDQSMSEVMNCSTQKCYVYDIIILNIETKIDIKVCAHTLKCIYEYVHVCA